MAPRRVNARRRRRPPDSFAMANVAPLPLDRSLARKIRARQPRGARGAPRGSGKRGLNEVAPERLGEAPAAVAQTPISRK